MYLFYVYDLSHLCSEHFCLVIQIHKYSFSNINLYGSYRDVNLILVELTESLGFGFI